MVKNDYYFRPIVKVLTQINFILSPDSNVLVVVIVSVAGGITVVAVTVVVVVIYLKVRKER